MIRTSVPQRIVSGPWVALLTAQKWGWFLEGTTQGGSDGTHEWNEKGTQDGGGELLLVRGPALNRLRPERSYEPGYR